MPDTERDQTAPSRRLPNPKEDPMDGCDHARSRTLVGKSKANRQVDQCNDCGAFIEQPPKTADARWQALNEAWQAVHRAVRPLGTECGQSPWNAGYTEGRDKALNAILALRDA